MKRYNSKVFLVGITVFVPLILGAFSKHSKNQTSYSVIVDTDLGGDPDDIQSLYRLIHYSDIVNVEGIVSTPNTQHDLHPWDTLEHVELIKHWVKRVDVDHLRAKGFKELQKEATLLKCVKAGTQTPGSPKSGGNTEGSDWIIKQAQKHSANDPLWILVWGSLTTTAQALYDSPDIAPNIRIYYIGSTNTEHDTASRNYVYRFMETQFPDLWWIENGILPKWSHETFRGVYESGIRTGEWSDTAFINAHIRGHGSTNKGLFTKNSGDAFPSANRKNTKLKEGDSPSILFLISPVLGSIGDVDDPTSESWGGQFRNVDSIKYPNYYIDLDTTKQGCMYTIGKWRKDFLGDWRERWDRYE